jgi:hypothetical protein
MLGSMLAALAAALSLGTPPAAAQLTTLAPSEAVACLTPPVAERGEPEYPLMLYKSGTKGRVVVAATFKGTDFFPTPSIAIETQEGGEEFVESIKKHLLTLRVPCLPRNGQATLRFDFIFDPNSPRVFWDKPVDVADASRREMLKCVVGLKDEKPPNYPLISLREERQGRVWATARYVAPDQAPEVKVHHRLASKHFAEEVESWLKQRRMPCLKGEPIQAELFFIFRQGNDVYGFRPLTLLQYMGVVKDVDRQVLQFDTRNMGCPFDLKLTYRQPDGKNLVGEVGERNPARGPLLEWLATSVLDMRRPQLDAVYADTADIHVPCLNINLKPKE